MVSKYLKLINCPTDIMLHITSFLDNKSNINLIETCKYLYKYGQKFGFLKSIQFNYKENYNIFLERYNIHRNTIKKIKVNGVENPHLWIPNYTETLIFSHCSIYEYINPGPRALLTKVFILTDYHRYKNHIKLRINWDCFINLEILELYVYDVDIIGIHKLSKLRQTKINTIIK
jgi:hypothetical protein